MTPTYYTSESDSMPEELDTESSPTTVYFRKDIHEEERHDETTGETRIVYVYQEAKIPRNEHNEYMIGKTLADLEFLYMMTGVDYLE